MGMNDIKIKMDLNGEELWRIKCALKRDLDNSLDFASKHDNPHRVFKMNAEQTLKLYLKIATLVESYQSVQATLDKYPLGELKTIR